MFRIPVFFLLTLPAIFISNCVGTQGIPYKDRLIIAVADFANQSNYADADKMLGQYSGSLIYHLQKQRTFRIIERKRLHALMKEHSLSMAGLVDPLNAKKAGKILGVDALLMGNLATLRFTEDRSQAGPAVTKTDNVEAVVDAQVILVETGEIIASSRATGKESNTVRWIGENMKTGNRISRSDLARKAIMKSTEKLAGDLARQAATIR